MKETTKTLAMVFGISFIANTARHSSAECWYMEKPEVKDTLGLSSSWLGALDSVFLICYAVGNYGSGLLGDRFSLRKVLAQSLLYSSFIYFLVTSP